MPSIRRERTAITTQFFLTGALFASWAARLPATQDRLGLSPGALSVALLGLEAGALAGLPCAGRLVARIGSPDALRIGFILFPAALVLAAIAPTLAALIAAAIAMGAGNSVIDVAMNAHGIELERRARRPLLSGLHSGHSFGVVAGGLAGTALAAHGVPPALHFAVAAGLAVAVGQLAAGALLDDGRRVAPGRATTSMRPLAVLGTLAFCAFFVEGAANDWSAIHTRNAHDAGATVGAAAFTAFSLMLALGRVAGDRVIGAVGRARTIQAAALLAGIGAAGVVVAPSAGAALAAWAGLGLGVAPLAPTLIGAAPSSTTAPAASAVATVSMIGYAGSFAGPPAIGVLAELTSLSAALGTLVAGALGIALLAPRGLAIHHLARRDCAGNPAVLRSDQRTTGP